MLLLACKKIGQFANRPIVWSFDEGLTTYQQLKYKQTLKSNLKFSTKRGRINKKAKTAVRDQETWNFKFDPERNKAAFCANFKHSFDSQLMYRVRTRCRNWGIYTVGIHDAYLIDGHRAYFLRQIIFEEMVSLAKIARKVLYQFVIDHIEKVKLDTKLRASACLEFKSKIIDLQEEREAKLALLYPGFIIN